MQVLYSLSRDPQLNLKEASKRYNDNIGRSYQLYLLNLWKLTQVACYSLQDKQVKTSKLLPTEEDKSFTAKLCENPLVQSIIQHRKVNALIKHYQLGDKIDDDIIRKLYYEFAKTDAYKAYVNQAETSNEEHIEILLQLYKSCLNNELYVDQMEDHYPCWIDDKSLVIGSIKKTIKALPVEEDFLDNYQPPEDAVKDFGETLLQKVYTDDAQLLELIEPTLKNWDAERVAVIDMILLKMAICELISFPTIPTKVTLNEFVEISKLYSTDKSKDFINGILDRLLKKLHDDGRINKEGRGLIE